jgi:hypothetical protein
MWDALFGDLEPQVRAATLWHVIADEHVALLADDPDPEVRRRVCATRWSSLAERHRAALLADCDCSATLIGAAPCRRTRACLDGFS